MPEPEPEPLGADQLLRRAIESLQNGAPVEARADLNAVLEEFPGNRIARMLMRQIDAEPASLFEGVVTTREVEPGDSLAAISAEAYGDGLWFYGLARLNGIEVPRLISVGQQLLVPAEVNAMPPPPQPETATATTEEPPAGQGDEDAAAAQSGDSGTDVPSDPAGAPAPDKIVIDDSDPVATAGALPTPAVQCT